MKIFLLVLLLVHAASAGPRLTLVSSDSYKSALEFFEDLGFIKVNHVTLTQFGLVKSEKLSDHPIASIEDAGEPVPGQNENLEDNTSIEGNTVNEMSTVAAQEDTSEDQIFKKFFVEALEESESNEENDAVFEQTRKDSAMFLTTTVKPATVEEKTVKPEYDNAPNAETTTVKSVTVEEKTVEPEYDDTFNAENFETLVHEEAKENDNDEEPIIKPAFTDPIKSYMFKDIEQDLFTKEPSHTSYHVTTQVPMNIGETTLKPDSVDPLGEETITALIEESNANTVAKKNNKNTLEEPHMPLEGPRFRWKDDFSNEIVDTYKEVKEKSLKAPKVPNPPNEDPHPIDPIDPRSEEKVENTVRKVTTDQLFKPNLVPSL